MIPRSITFWVIFACLFPTWAESETPLQLPPGQRQLFLDDHVVDRMEGLRRVMHQPVKRGPVLKAEHDWEGRYIGVFSPPLWISEEGVFKQVYECRYDTPGQRHRYALAVSRDGLHWEKPSLGLVKFNGSDANNLFPTPDNRRLVHVVFDPDDPDPQQRYKGLLTVSRGRVPVVSPDCLHWRKLDSKLPSSDAGTFSFDRDKRLFMALLKRGNKNTVGRSYDVSTSQDFITWSQPRLMFGMDADLDQEMAIDVIQRRLIHPALAKPMFIDPDPAIGWQNPQDKRHIPTWRAECYNFGVIPYEGIYLGLITVFYPTGQSLPKRNNTDGFNLIQLAMSRDLEDWRRLGERQPFLEPSPLTDGLVGNYDRLQLAAYNGLITHADEIRFYYGGLKRRVPMHDRWTDGRPRDPETLSDSERADWLEDTHSAMCLAVLRRDGFVSLGAGDKEGWVLTKTLKLRGSRLLINLEVTTASGHATVELLDESGRTLAVSRPLTGKGIRQPVRWKQTTDLDVLFKNIIQLKIRLQHANLYAFWAE